MFIWMKSELWLLRKVQVEETNTTNLLLSWHSRLSLREEFHCTTLNLLRVIYRHGVPWRWRRLSHIYFFDILLLNFIFCHFIKLCMHCRMPVFIGPLKFQSMYQPKLFDEFCWLMDLSLEAFTAIWEFTLTKWFYFIQLCYQFYTSCFFTTFFFKANKY
jgi:hypothetical protein